MNINEKQIEVMQRLAAEYSTILKPFSTPFGVGLFPEYPEIPQSELRSARLYQNRYIAISDTIHGGVGAEVGTQDGHFARFLLDNLNPRSLHLFDLSRAGVEEHNGEILSMKNIKMQVGQSSEMMSQYEDNYFDWIYIDADHSYDGVTKDIASSEKKLKSGGFLIFNDYTSWSPLEMSEYGVVPAVNELVSRGGWDVIYIALGRLSYNDICIRKA